MSNGFANNHDSEATKGYTIEELCFLCEPYRDYIMEKIQWRVAVVEEWGQFGNLEKAKQPTFEAVTRGLAKTGLETVVTSPMNPTTKPNPVYSQNTMSDNAACPQIPR
jgi:hypothetical protein